MSLKDFLLLTRTPCSNDQLLNEEDYEKGHTPAEWIMHLGLPDVPELYKIYKGC